MIGGAGPGVEFGMFHDAGPDRVELNIRQRIPDVGAGQDAGEIARLPEVAASAVGGVDVAGVGGVHPFQGEMEGIRRLRDRDQVDVVRHQAESGELQAVHLRGFCEEPQVNEAVAIFKEDRPVIRAPLGDVVGIAAGDSARNTSHTMT